MRGIVYDFNVGDVVISESGPFVKGTIDNQNVALIAVSQVCRITKPEIGAQIGARIVNRRTSEIAGVLANATCGSIACTSSID